MKKIVGAVNPQTTNALIFLTHIFLAIDGVLTETFKNHLSVSTPGQPHCSQQAALHWQFRYLKTVAFKVKFR